MKQQLLFKTSRGEAVTSEDLRAALANVVGSDCEVLYMHTCLSFGIPNPDLARAELLDAMYQVVWSLKVPTLVVPTFTFSFCNGEDYDSRRSKSRMGALNEFIRLRPEAVRSIDPLMSVAVVGDDRDLAENLSHDSIGANSTFDKLSRRKHVKFLFLGVGLGDCFTYMHHLEWVARIPYRYERGFTGKITHFGRTYEDTYRLFVRYHNVKPNAASYAYENLLVERGMLRVASVGDGSVRCIGESEAREVYLDLLRKDPDYFITEPFRPERADRTFLVENMVAL